MNAKTAEITQKVKNMVSARSTALLVADFERTSEMQMTENLPVVRGWIMDELEARNPAAFEAWMEANTESPREFYL